MTPEERIEAVARALCRADSPRTDVDEHWDAYVDDARAAILTTLQSLLDPSDDIVSVGILQPGDARALFERMIRAAIKAHS